MLSPTYPLAQVCTHGEQFGENAFQAGVTTNSKSIELVVYKDQQKGQWDRDDGGCSEPSGDLLSLF